MWEEGTNMCLEMFGRRMLTEPAVLVWRQYSAQYRYPNGDSWTRLIEGIDSTRGEPKVRLISRFQQVVLPKSLIVRVRQPEKGLQEWELSDRWWHQLPILPIRSVRKYNGIHGYALSRSSGDNLPYTSTDCIILFELSGQLQKDRNGQVRGTHGVAIGLLASTGRRVQAEILDAYPGLLDLTEEGVFA